MFLIIVVIWSLVSNEEDSEYQKVANRKDLKEGGMLKVEVLGKSILLSMVNGEVYAIDAVCSHEGGPLEDGILDGFEVECPWHGSRFDVRTGEVRNPPADIPQLAYEVKIDGDGIMIKEKPQSEEQQLHLKKERPLHELNLFQKNKVEGTDMMSFKFSNQEENRESNKRSLNYTAGQYAYFDIGGVENDSKGPIRHFTIASSPTENFIMISTRIRDTPYKKRLASLEEGTIVKVKGPEGKFVLHDDYSKSAVFLSGGIGVTPFRSMIKNATDNQLPVKIALFDSNRNEQNILYKDEFDGWANINQNLVIVYTITDEDESSPPASEWRGERGRIDKSMLAKYLTKDELHNSIYYTCGPPGMIEAMQTLLQKDLQIPKDRIMVEEFSGY
jgi:ferredoxin-NADP reductase/nitrite reductase/ring-hydroxylating ferredoxin subunit